MDSINVDGSKLTIQVGGTEVHKCKVVDAKCNTVFTRAMLSIGALKEKTIGDQTVRLWSKDAAKVDLYETLQKAKTVGELELGTNSFFKEAKEVARKMTEDCWKGLKNYKNISMEIGSVISTSIVDLYVGLAMGVRAIKAYATSAVDPLSGKRLNQQACGMNPKDLTDEQKTKQPILLIHGNGGGPSHWIPLAKHLQAKALGRPVFTVYLPNKGLPIGEADYKIVADRMKEIEALYGEESFADKKFDFIGHSRGATIADQMASGLCLKMEGAPEMGQKGGFKFSTTGYSDKRVGEKIGKVIKLDCPTFHPEVANKLNKNDMYEVNGKGSMLRRWKSVAGFNDYEKKTHVKEVDGGHGWPLYSKEAHEFIFDILSPSQVETKDIEGVLLGDPEANLVDQKDV